MINMLARTTRAHCSGVSRRVRVPRESVVVTYSRSSGPGGQNVNKVSTKASLRLDVSERSAWWLPPAVRERLLERQRGGCHQTRWLLRQSLLTRPRDSFLQAPSPRAANCCSRATRRDRRRATWRSASSGCRRRWTRRASSRGSMSTGARCRRRRGGGTSGSGRSGSTAERRRAARAGG
ncbi:hypothetical protein EMIHUDRAFT_451635 [Emiliania huxleyi CCMP1516]|uniref:Prokaryotic-type class I peptide chain release factors domain-containing protein n=2 Tax=Emiliania huxleyi TaxID=2903 RepID=A0A0D3IXQ3_EMIH1|nr:hypothetical protein EMIHUDRAFT_451635 [Emiliania huxleyi CCMP1516]EOD16038.1 hypothetical protein EMIHUDRAFT_451635 [Emiliania huxleyi CCMP1516]|eukprot:XP_005768467.1 hypothetical protein EMIHUDRAFT_451635 [Emiliania huxleyi CCMP1516]